MIVWLTASCLMLFSCCQVLTSASSSTSGNTGFLVETPTALTQTSSAAKPIPTTSSTIVTQFPTIPLPLSFDRFHTLDEYYGILRSMETQPSALGLHTIGFSVEGRPILALGVGSNTPAVEILIMGLTHGCEWQGGELSLDLAQHLLLPSDAEAAQVGRILQRTSIWIVPVLNPDGYLQSGNGDPTVANNWRKNRRLIGEPPFDPERDGVDINRNFSIEWTAKIGDESIPIGSRYYPGSSPFSEPESQAIRDFAAIHEFRLSLALHSYGNQIYFPWGFTNERIPDFDAFYSLAESIAELSDIQVSLEYSGGPTPGNSDDYLYDTSGTYAYTIEIGVEHFPPTETLATVLEEKMPGLLYAIEQAPFLPSTSKQTAHNQQK